MAGLDNTLFAGAMKEDYTPNKLNELVLTKRPMMAIIDKKTDFVGLDEKQPALYGNPQNRSANFAAGQSGTSTSSLAGFAVTTIEDYSFGTIANKTIEATKSNKGAFKSALKVEVDGAVNSLANSMARQIYRSGWGEIGKIGTITGTTITLNVSSDAFYFEKGMRVVFSSSLNAAGLRSGTPVTVNAVNRSPTSGSITISATTGSPQNGDYIFCFGDREDSATPTKRCMSGLSAWIPSGGVAVGSGDNFFGVDRSVDSRLYGTSIDGSLLNIEDAILYGIEQSVANSGNPDYVMINPIQYLALVRLLGSKVLYTDIDVPSTKIAFRGIEVQGPAGVVIVMSDIYCQGDRAWVIESENLLLHSTGDAPKIFDTDGLPFLRSAASDGVDVRVYSYAQTRVLTPAHFVNVQLALP